MKYKIGDMYGIRIASVEKHKKEDTSHHPGELWHIWRGPRLENCEKENLGE